MEMGEDLYKVLGTTAKISQSNLKKKYVQKVKQFPPEQHPEQFEKIRYAYETLSDPEKREQYDFARKFGGRFSKLVEKAKTTADRGDWEEAENLFRQSLSIKSDDISVYENFIIRALEYDKVDIVYEQLSDIKNAIDEDKQKGLYYKILYECLDLDESEVALNIFTHYFEQNRSMSDMVDFGQVAIGLLLREELEFEEVFDTILNLEQLFLGQGALEAVRWILLADAIGEAERWNLQSKVQAEFRKLMKTLSQEDKQLVYDQLVESIDEYQTHHSYLMAELYVQLLAITDPQNKDVKQMRANIKEKVKFEKQLFKLAVDDDIFPVIHIKAMQFYKEMFEEFEEVDDHLDMLDSFYNMMAPEEFRDEMIHEGFVTGIVLIKKKYPAVFNQFKNEWMDLYNEHIQHVNRDMRRKYKL